VIVNTALTNIVAKRFDAGIRLGEDPRRNGVPGWAWTALLKFVADDGKIDGVGPL